MRLLLGPAAFVLTSCTLACGSDSAGNVTAPSPQAVLSSIQLTGRTDLTAIGQTSQLTLNARYTDGSRTDPAGIFQLISFASARIRIEHPDYEVFEREVLRPAAPSRMTSLDVPLQRMVRISAGQSRSGLVIAPNDVG